MPVGWAQCGEGGAGLIGRERLSGIDDDGGAAFERDAVSGQRQE
ncbi:hypothetical protein HMPREF0004_3022 [Achromobacter piechaudii ATCC 43553]|uniref:Uncharacterized protein n=1 Tax=Achromobacter piechaudii ATCC 43553 TaxID=742159 RepID=D4XC25_9BURK|nr:hypothetical protein HMPREF0004_3022 [Achromobacter piechaudii ATCC 43553]